MSKIIIRTHKRKTKRGSTLVKKHIRKISEKFRNKKYIESLKRGKPELPFREANVFKTTFIQDKKTGLLRGRRRIEGSGDRTAIQIDERTGRIFGRVPKKKIKLKKR